MAVVCLGKCKGTDRPVWESPAKVQVISVGKRLIVCECCGSTLSLASGKALTEAPNISKSVETKSLRFVDDVCEYDVVLLTEIQEIK